MTMAIALQLAGGAVVLALFSALVSFFPGGARRFVVMPLFASAGLLALVAGVVTLFNGGVTTAELPLGLPWLPWQVRLDALSGFFLCVVGVVSFAVGLYAPGYVRGFEHGHDSLRALTTSSIQRVWAPRWVDSPACFSRACCW